MRTDRRRAIPLAALAVAVVAFGVALGGRPAPGEIGLPETGGIAAVPEGPVVLECWQNGVRIINQSGLTTPGMGAGQNRITFGRANGREGAVLIGFPEGLCLVRAQ